MFGRPVKNVVAVCLWISLFQSAVPRSNSLRSKNGPGIFDFGDRRSGASTLRRLRREDPAFIHQSGGQSAGSAGGVFCGTGLARTRALFQAHEENIPDPEYNFSLYERKWQDFWEDTKLFQTQDPEELKNRGCDAVCNSGEESSFGENGDQPKNRAPELENDPNALTHLDESASDACRSGLAAGSACEYTSLNLTRGQSSPGPEGTAGAAAGAPAGHDARAETGPGGPRNIECATARPKYYILSMIPYPSGKGLHVGHLLGYTAVDVIARYKRLNNFNVLNPVGFDCFGIPTEVYSRSVGRSPEEVTRENVASFRRQLRSMGFSFDFARELRTCDVDYYRWTQWVFQRMFLAGLAFRDRGYVNFCPALGSELSNEEVSAGRSVRGGFDVYKRLRTMWKLRITAYAQRLYEDLERVDYPPRLVTLQRNWINPRRGYLVRFQVQGAGGGDAERPGQLVAFVEDLASCGRVEALELPVLLEDALEYCSPQMRPQVRALLEESLKMSNLELSNERNRRRLLSGLSALNPYNGRPVPVYVTNALVHTDARINCRPVLAAEGLEAQGEQGGCSTDSSPELESGACPPSPSSRPDNWFEEYLSFNIRDWVFSRNRGWGEPIPILPRAKGAPEEEPSEGHCCLGLGKSQVAGSTAATPSSSADSGAGSGVCAHRDGPENVFNLHATPGAAPEPGEELLAELPVPLTDGVRETMPQWAGSCWHFLRFVDPHNPREIFDRSLAEYWLPVDLYVGGVEHSVSHLLYSRFWTKFLYDINVSPVSEPFRKIILHGVVKTASFYLPRAEFELLPAEVRLSILARPGGQEGTHAPHGCCEPSHEDGAGTHGSHGGPGAEVEVPASLVMKHSNRYVLRSNRGVEVRVRMKKMSKSRGNVINPEEILARFGSDALRMHLMFLGPIERDKVWSVESIGGVYKLLRGINSLCSDFFKETGRHQLGDPAAPVGPEAGELGPPTGLECTTAESTTAHCLGPAAGWEGGSRGEEHGEQAGQGEADWNEQEAMAKVNRFIENVTWNMENFKLNKISEFFSFFRLMQAWRARGTLPARVVEAFLVMLSPYAPHLAEELWHQRHLARRGPGPGPPGAGAGAYRSIALERWPRPLNVP